MADGRWQIGKEAADRCVGKPLVPEADAECLDRVGDCGAVKRAKWI
jgi:hypothetical protein